MEKLTPSEEEAMLVIWSKKGGFVKDILEGLSGEKPPYTTLASTVKNLEKKGFVKAVKYANAFRYEPAIPQESYKREHVGNVVSGYFKNSYKELVSFFAQEEKITPDDLQEILKMIQNGKS
ncbi:BlaI/MecI/CopY family transcriptional regulator [Emticicia sp. ODNR4P]|nr:BlaI/MecI/CopY family transcriptional regulator [Emticicia sp. ODNR4P]